MAGRTISEALVAYRRAPPVDATGDERVDAYLAVVFQRVAGLSWIGAQSTHMQAEAAKISRWLGTLPADDHETRAWLVAIDRVLSVWCADLIAADNRQRAADRVLA